jgi:hypothetical protein
MLSSVNSLTKTIIPSIQQVRGIRYRKAPTLPRAKGKKFYVNVKPEWDPTELALSKKYWAEYKAQMRSVYQLFKAENKFMGQQSEKVRLENERLMKREGEVLRENEYDSNFLQNYRIFHFILFLV